MDLGRYRTRAGLLIYDDNVHRLKLQMHYYDDSAGHVETDSI